MRTHTVPATGRLTIEPGADGPVDERFGALIEANLPIAAERAMYWSSGGVFWAAGTNASATRVP